MPTVQCRMIDANVARMWRWLARGWLHGFDQITGDVLCLFQWGFWWINYTDHIWPWKTSFQATPFYQCTSMTFILGVSPPTRRHFGRSIPFCNVAQPSKNDQFYVWFTGPFAMGVTHIVTKCDTKNALEVQRYAMLFGSVESMASFACQLRIVGTAETREFCGVNRYRRYPWETE